MQPRLADALALLCVASGLLTFALLRWCLRDLRKSCANKKAERLAVNAAACFFWPALVWGLMRCTGQVDLGLAALLSCVIVLAYLCQEAKAVLPYVGALDDYQGGDSLHERAKQISTAAFATGTILLSTTKELAGRVAPVVFLALLLCVISAVPGGGASQHRKRKHLTWESIQKASISMAAGLLALAIATCVDVNLLPKCS